MLIRTLLALWVVLIAGGCATQQEPGRTPDHGKPDVGATAPRLAPKIALVLGGGAARGFAHIGVIKTLEAQGIVPDIVVGTSAGSVVGALYAGGYGGFDLQKVAFGMEDASVGDWTIPDRGFIKGDNLQNFVNGALQNRPIEKLNKVFAAVATDLQSGEQMVFRRGNTGLAVRASSSVPGVFQPAQINGREYVDGGLTSPVPVSVARKLGATLVIAVDISARPKYARVNDSVDVLLQTFSIMGQRLASYELADADIVIRPNTGAIGPTEFEQKHLAILEGEKAALAAMPLIRSKLRQLKMQ